MPDNQDNSREMRFPAFHAYDDVYPDFKFRRTVVIGEGTTEDDMKAFLKSLVETPQIPAKVRYAAAAAAGISIQEQKRDARYGEMIALAHLLKEIKARMRSNGERPIDIGIHQAALNELAEQQGMDADTLRDRFKRFRRRRRRRAMSAAATLSPKSDTRRG
jgi:hypothetical protein